MNPLVRVRITFMMFFNYLIWGAWYVTIGTFLGQSLQFDGAEIGLVYGALSIAAILSPIFVGKIADRFFSSEKVLGMLHLIGALLMFLASQQTEFMWMYIFIFLYSLCYMPTIALTNAIAMAQMENPDKEFPWVRVFGSAGWIVMGLLLSYLKIEAQSTPLIIAAFASVGFGIYSFTLPGVPPKKEDKSSSIKELLGLDAIALMKNKSFAVLVISSLLISIPLSFYYSFTNFFLNDIKFEDVAGKMTLGQISEVFFMILMPFFFRRLGVKKMILFGMAAWVVRYLLFGFGNVDDLASFLYLGIILHGICYDFFFVTGQIYVDNRAPLHLKNSAQGLMTQATYGVGMAIGTLFSGSIVDYYTVEGVKDWQSIWMVPAGIALVVLIIFTVFFKDDTEGGRLVQS